MYTMEHTDTFGGEANYAWVRRATLPERKRPYTDRALVRAAKAWAGYSGHPCRVENWGDTIAIYPRGVCHVIFVSWRED